MSKQFSFYEFFAGGGMARAGLGPSWQCLFANDYDAKKSATYQRNWGGDELYTGDIKDVLIDQLPGKADLAWASFPCQDLSLAGVGAGLQGERSGTFWPFWQKIQHLNIQGRSPKIVVLENVLGTLSSHGGQDFVAICNALKELDYRFGAMVVNASYFVPQSRPRLFIVAVRESLNLPSEQLSDGPMQPWHSRAVRQAYERLPGFTKSSWIWWHVALPRPRAHNFVDLIEDRPDSVSWHTPEETDKILAMMSEINLAKVHTAMRSECLTVGTIYKRTRPNADGTKNQRAEVRFDNIAGCLRTPAGGSSRQVLLVVNGADIRSRLISSRETARLMGLSDAYELPERYNEAYHLTGDGVVVPVVTHLAKQIFEPILLHIEGQDRAAA